MGCGHLSNSTERASKEIKDSLSNQALVFSLYYCAWPVQAVLGLQVAKKKECYTDAGRPGQGP